MHEQELIPTMMKGANWLIPDSRLLSLVLSGTNPSVKCGDPVLDQDLPVPEADPADFLNFNPAIRY